MTLPSRWVQGFSRPISGTLLVYPWAYPGQARALLTRTTDGKMAVEWEAEAPPPGRGDEPVSFLWHAGFASGYGAHRFTLSVNGSGAGNLHVRPRHRATARGRVAGAGGATLAFQTTRVGTFNELFGLMMLTVPRRGRRRGPPRFAVVGEAAGSQDYYMTFEEPVARPGLARRVEQARFKDGRRVVRLEVSHIGNAAPFVVRSGGRDARVGDAASRATTDALAAAGSGGAPTARPHRSGRWPRRVASETLTLAPVRALGDSPARRTRTWTSATRIPSRWSSSKQWKNLRDAVALAARTAANPPEARFRWNVEGLWSVESYLEQATPDERKAFVGRGARRVDRSAGELHQHPDRPVHAGGTDTLDRRGAGGSRPTSGLPVGRSAMHTDIPGLSWTVVRALARGRRPLLQQRPELHAVLPDRGDRIGHTLKRTGRPSVLVGVAVGTGTRPVLDGRPRLLARSTA